MSEQLNEIVSRLGRIEGKQDLTLKNLERHEETLDKHGARINHVENHQSRVLGWATGVAGAFSFAITYLFKG